MTKPSAFSFKGLGEPLKEFRELIKDLWYRNRQEHDRGEIELAKQCLALDAEFKRVTCPRRGAKETLVDHRLTTCE